jgi:hypothetical protein
MSLENLLNNGTPVSSTPNESKPATESAQAPVQSAQNEPKPVDNEPKPNFARQFTALSRREREIVQREKMMAEKEKSLQSGSDKYNEFTRKLKLSPIEALQEAGVDIDYITNAHLSGKVPDHVKTSTEVEDLRAQIQALTAKLEGKDEPEENLTPEQKAEKEFQQGMYEFLDSSSEKYKLIHKQEAHEVVWQAIDEIFKDSVKQGNPRIPSYEEAADMVERYLRDEAKQLAEELGYASKQEPADQGSSKPVSTSSQTLSNQHSTTRPTEAQGSRLLSREESLARAASLLKHL